jgi:ribosomal-protein-alanine N-acetyltransferase
MRIMNFEIQTDRLKLKLLDESYAGSVADYHLRNKDFFKQWVPSYTDDHFAVDMNRRRLKQMLEDFKEGRAIKLWIFKRDDADEKKIIGDISFSQIVYEPFLSCFLGYKIDEQENNSGYASEAIKAGIEYIFNNLKLHRIEANIMPHNEKSIRVVERLGFENEGISKKYLKINGKWEDHLHYVKLNPLVE